MQDKIVIITGAGFSAPANLPVQNRILMEMVEPLSNDFLTAQIARESVKFLTAYIHVAVFLLKEYTNISIEEYIDKYNIITNKFHSNEVALEIIEYIKTNYGPNAEEKNFNLVEKLNETIEKCSFGTNDYYLELMNLKEKLRVALQKSNIQVSLEDVFTQFLEDVFTQFDKSISMRENTTDYSYAEMDQLQHSILRLFIYYFANRVNEHKFNFKDYLDTIEYIKNHNNVSVITTNWDVLLEEYFNQSSINYDYRFNSSYVLDHNGKIYDECNSGIRGIPYIKIHGSINWFRCLKCGTLQVSEIRQCGKYLFDDEIDECCVKCGQVVKGEQVQLKPEIITPTMIKSINSQLYNNLWQNAAYELQQAKKIIFCGYSMPTADYEFRYLLKQNISRSANIDVVLYHNDDPTKVSDITLRGLLPEKRYRDLFPNNNCKFIYDGFGAYFGSIKN